MRGLYIIYNKKLHWFITCLVLKYYYDLKIKCVLNYSFVYKTKKICNAQYTSIYIKKKNLYELCNVNTVLNMLPFITFHLIK